MSRTQRSPSAGWTLAAVVAGVVIAAGLSLVTDVALHVLGIFPALGQTVSNPLLLLATFYRSIYGVMGSYVTARLAPVRPMLHSLVLGGAGMVVSIAGALATWNKGAAFGPHWYPIALIVLALPTAWLGGWIYLRHQSKEKS